MISLRFGLSVYAATALVVAAFAFRAVAAEQAPPGLLDAVPELPKEPPGRAPLSPEAERGRRIFLSGVSALGSEISAAIGEAPPVDARTLPCASCHGRDGRGRPEGGLAPSDIRWSVLTKPYGVENRAGRSHPPYDERSFKRAVTLGIDPEGQKLGLAMPRYRLSQADMSDLLAYLQRLGTEPVPGVSANKIRLGTLLAPGEGGEAVRRVLNAAVEETNAQGGIFGRTLELAPCLLAGTAADRRAQAASCLDADAPLALVAPSLAGAEAEISALLEEREVPAVGAVGVRVPAAADLGRAVFWQTAALESQAAALAVAASRAVPAAPRIALVVAEGAEFSALASAALSTFEDRKQTLVADHRYDPEKFAPAALAESLSAPAAVDAIVFLGPGRDQAALLTALARLGLKPFSYSLGAYAREELFALPAGFGGRLYLAFPGRPFDANAPAAERWRRLAQAKGLTTADLSSQGSALAAFELLTDALEKAGRDLDRDRLVAELEKRIRILTPYTPPLAFGPGRRLGARGAYLVVIDAERHGFVPVGEWVGAGD